MSSAPPTIFSNARRLAILRRMRALQRVAGAPHYLLDDMLEDVTERLAFLRHAPQRALVIGDFTGTLAGEHVAPEEGFDEEAPFPTGCYDFIASLGTLDTVNDLPGALVHLREALASGGLLIASFVGAGCLPRMRAAMLAAWLMCGSCWESSGSWPRCWA